MGYDIEHALKAYASLAKRYEEAIAYMEVNHDTSSLT